MLIAQISDLHVQERPGLDGVLASTHLRRCIATLNRLNPRPDLVLMTGDLTERGGLQEYRMLQSVIGELDIPYLLIPGNHDHPDHLRAVFAQDAYLQAGHPFIQYVDESWPVRIVALDTTTRGGHHGVLCPERLQWLAARLAEQPDRTTVVMMHHLPVDTGIRQMDAIGLLEGRDEFVRIVGAHANVERVLCGHLHRTIFCRIGQTLACSCPGTAHQVELDLADPGRLADNFEPPGYLLHWVRPGATITHHAVIGDYEGPYYE